MRVSADGSKRDDASSSIEARGIDARLVLAKRKTPMKKNALLIEEDFSS
jgi:hypothetical protein